MLLVAMLAIVFVLCSVTSTQAIGQFDIEDHEVESDEALGMGILSAVLDDEDFAELSEGFDLGCTVKCTGFWACVGTSVLKAYQNKSVAELAKLTGCNSPSGCICHKPWFM